MGFTERGVIMVGPCPNSVRGVAAAAARPAAPVSTKSRRLNRLVMGEAPSEAVSPSGVSGDPMVSFHVDAGRCAFKSVISDLAVPSTRRGSAHSILMLSS